MAVCDILYKEEAEWEEDSDDDYGISDDDVSNNSEDEVEEHEDVNGNRRVKVNMKLSPIIKKVRRLVRLFCGPVNNSTLQLYCKREFGHELRLIRDTKTRWNSLKDMLVRFLKIKNSIKKALVDLDKSELFPNKEEIHILKSLCDALEIVSIGSQKICAQRCTLTQANDIFDFMFDQLESLETHIASNIYSALKTRIIQRREDSLTSLLLYLENSEDYKYSSLKFESRTKLAQFAQILYDRLFPHEERDGDVDIFSDVDQQQTEDIPQKKSKLADELECFLGKRQKIKEKRGNVPKEDTLVIMGREMNVYESSGERPFSLERIYKALITIPPTSVESERAFSALGRYATKVRANLEDNTIDKLCLLKNYFLRQQKLKRNESSSCL